MNYKTKLKQITTFVFDVDGVMTDNTVLLSSSGEMVRTMNVRDGFALRYALKKGFRICVISAGNSQMVRKRLNYLGIEDVYLEVANKLEVLGDYCSKNDIDIDNVLYIGDDIPDFDCIKAAGIGACPRDAANEIRIISNYISHYNGGHGCVREIIEQVLKEQQLWMNELEFNIDA